MPIPAATVPGGTLRTVVAAAPAWFADNLTVIATGTLLVLTVLVIRMIQKAMVRVVLLGLIGGVAIFVYANNDALKRCATTCECRLVGRDITIPACDPRLDLSLAPGPSA